MTNIIVSQFINLFPRYAHYPVIVLETVHTKHAKESGRYVQDIIDILFIKISEN